MMKPFVSIFVCTLFLMMAPVAQAMEIESTRAAAERGDFAAQMAMGAFYRHGMGVPQSDTESAQWYLKAAAQGDAGAQTNVGMLYLTGQGVKQDEARAKSWLRKAAKQGDSSAQRQLKTMSKPSK